MSSAKRLDSVTIYGGKLSFLIPHEWVETEDGDDYLYHVPDTDSGWFRVTLITAKAVGETPAEHLDKLFGSRHNPKLEPLTGNLVHAFEKDSEEDGVPIHLYYWLVANVVPPNLVREAVFSYTVLRNRVDEDETRETVALLEQLVSRADLRSSA